MATINVKDATGATVTIGKFLPGRAAAADSAPQTLSTEDKAAIDLIAAAAGAPADAAAGTDTASASQISLFKRLLQKFTAQFPAALGRVAAALSMPVALSTEDKAVLDNLNTSLSGVNNKQPVLAISRTVMLNTVTATGPSSAIADTGRAPSWSFSLTGSGAIAATVLVQARNVSGGEWGTLATVNMSGTTATGDIAATVIRYMEYRVNCTAISGTSATLTATMAA